MSSYSAVEELASLQAARRKLLNPAKGDFVMGKRVLWTAACLLLVGFFYSANAPKVEAAPPGQPNNWNRFYHYPYVYYPHNLQAPVTYDHMYYRYPRERQIPVYNEGWHNFYPGTHPYHKGFHNKLDVF